MKRPFRRASLATSLPPYPGSPIRALSLREPWGSLIADGWKDIENRNWKPPLHAGPTWLAIHTSRTDMGLLEVIQEQALAQGQRIAVGVTCCPSAIIGAMLIDGVVEESDSPWFLGPLGWTVRAVVKFAEPIRNVKGSLSTWTLPPLVYSDFKDRWANTNNVYRTWEKTT